MLQIRKQFGIICRSRRMKSKSKDADLIVYEANKGYQNDKAKETFKRPPYSVKVRKEKE